MGTWRRVGMWLRWSLRDLRRRWIVVAAIALVIAVGTGTYAGMGSMEGWRHSSYDQSYAALGMHDVRVRLSEGSFVPAGALREVALGLDGVDVAVAEERLVVPTQLDASTPDETILVRGQVVGLPPDARIDRLHLTDGRRFADPGAGTDAASAGSRIEGVLEAKFARWYDLPVEGSLTLAGEREAHWVGQGVVPEQFWITPEEGGSLLAVENFGVLYVPLATAQAVAGRTDGVNDLVIHLAPGATAADQDAAAAVLEEGFARQLPDVGVTVETGEDNPGRRFLDEDIDGDQAVTSVLAGLILAGAAIGAFNLVSRLVEAQRREVGIGMALGVGRGRLAIRPLLVGLEVALAGVIAGIGVGWLVASAMRSLSEDLIPLPDWQTSLQVGTFARAAALGIVIPLAATVWPVWRAVRVEPVDALKPAHLVARGGRSSSRPGRRSWGLRTWRLLPIRSLVRNPRRTLLTAVGVGAAITALVGVLGLLDTFDKTLDIGVSAMTRGSPDRVTVELGSLYPSGAPEVTAVIGNAAVGRAETGLQVGASLLAGRGDAGSGDDIAVRVRFLDLDGGVWHPAAEDGSTIAGDDGIVLAAKAASDLGVSAGDTVALRHPVASGRGYGMATTELRVLATHDGPLRFDAYMDLARAGDYGVAGVVNVIDVVPAAGQSVDDVQRALFTEPAVASAQPVAVAAETFEEALDEVAGIVRIAEVAVLALALLIAFNAASITADERQRDHATMFAFGLPTRSVLAVNTVESMILGALGTVVGLAAGYVTVWWMIHALFADTIPDIGLRQHVAPATIALVAVLGVGAVAVAPLLTARRLRRMDIPATLRLVE